MTTATPTSYEPIALDEEGTPWIPEANTKVAEIVAKVKADGGNPEELAYQLPHLTLGQIHSALAYHWDQMAEVDQDLKQREEEVDALRRAAGEDPLVAKLRARGQI